MDKKNVEDIVICCMPIDSVKEKYSDLSDDAQKQISQFITNNITMANNWIGISGDEFLFAANTVAAYLNVAFEFYNCYQDLLGTYQIKFNDINEELKNNISDVVKVG